MDSLPLTLNLKITATAWKTDSETKDLVRVWTAPPLSTANTAARVHKAGIWPFNRFEWAVWSPFANEDTGENIEDGDSVLSGEAANEKDAIDAADEALKKLIAAAEAAGP